MIKIFQSECVVDGVAVQDTTVKFLGITIFKQIKNTTNNLVLEQFFQSKEPNKIGFKKYENED